MVFSELSFLYIFLPICLILNLALKNTAARNAVLLIMSLLFYAWGEPIYVLLMIGISAVSWGFGLWLGRGGGKAVLCLGVIVVLLPLIFFKYSGFLAETIGSVFGAEFTIKKLALPIGISFYTFQIISYLVDVYRGNAKYQKNPFNFMLYVSMFPQLIAGPIVRYVDISSELASRSVTSAAMTEGAVRFMTGLGKKVILANTVGKVVTDVLSEPVSELGTAGSWGVMLCFSFQIYFDFSGYSDMAIGLGKMLGFSFPENFNYPYISSSIKEFWRRWHISMGSFFRDYVYIPLGGNRRHRLFNMLAVWALTGLWHGAGWNFILWGLYFFVLLTIQKYALGKIKLPKAPSILITLVLVMLGWVLFYFEDMSQCAEMFKIMFGFGGGSGAISNPILISAIPVLIICVLCSTPLPKKIKDKAFSALPAGCVCTLKAVYVSVMLFICTALIVTSTYNPFLYFRF